MGSTRIEGWEASPGGNGGNGGTGAAGGNGGQLKVIYVDGNNPILNAESKGEPQTKREVKGLLRA